MRRGPRSARCRRPGAPGAWLVRARVERFAEPLLLLLLRERPAHGYQLLDELSALVPGERVDMGNLYRALRAMEDDGIVASEWREDVPGPAKRTYELTASGRNLLDEWADALRRAREGIDEFLDRYEARKEVNDAR